MPAVDILREWMLQFLKSRDAFFRKISRMDVQSDGTIALTYKDGKEQRVIILPDFSAALQAVNRAKEDDHLVIATLNNRKNKEALMTFWKSLAPFKFLTLYFINPKSGGEKKWVLMPNVHQKVCDDANLGAGFAALSELVPDVNESEL